MIVKNVFFLVLCAFGLIITSCSSGNEEKLGDLEPAETNNSNFILPNEVDELMLLTDSEQEKMQQVKSLNYAKENNSLAYVTAYLDKNSVIKKMIFFKQIGETGKIINSIFYFNGGAQFASKIIQEKKDKNKKSFYSEVISFYDTKGKATSSKERKADFEELLDNEPFIQTKTSSSDTKEAYQVLNQKGEYTVTYQGFIESGDYLFLIVGSNTADGYTSSLSVQSLSPVVQYLRKSGSKELGRDLVVNYDHIMDQNGYEIQILRDVQFADVSIKN